VLERDKIGVPENANFAKEPPVWRKTHCAGLPVRIRLGREDRGAAGGLSEVGSEVVLVADSSSLELRWASKSDISAVVMARE